MISRGNFGFVVEALNDAAGDDRHAAYQRVFEHGDKLTAQVKDVPENEVESVIDEAPITFAPTPNENCPGYGILVRATGRATGLGWEFLLEIGNSGHTLITSAYIPNEVRRVLNYRASAAPL